MSNTDLINAYFRDEMTAVEKQNFEENLEKDAELKREFDFQKDIIEAVKQSRRAQLKAMLDKVPVGGSTVGGSTGGSTALGKAALVVAVTGLIGLGAYYLWPDNMDNMPASKNETTIVAPAEDENNTAASPDKKEEEPVLPKNELKRNKAAETPRTETPIAEQPAAGDKKTVTPEINKPDMAPAFETQEEVTDSLKAPGSNLSSKSYNNHASLDVEIISDNKKLNFHYQFKSGKLHLYGSFDQGLYEILEINDSHSSTLFLYYKGEFYHLKTDEVKVTPLEAVKKQSLIDRLEATRKS